MVSALVFLIRLVAGLVMLFVVWFVLDQIHDRNTEIIVATIGLLYSFIFMISRRLQYFGLTIFSFLGQTTSYIQNMPYDHLMRGEVGAKTAGRHLYLNALFAALIEILCLIRLFTSLTGRGWDTLFGPIHDILRQAQF